MFCIRKWDRLFMALLPMNTAKHFRLFMNGGVKSHFHSIRHLAAYHRESTNLDIFALLGVRTRKLVGGWALYGQTAGYIASE